MEFAPTASTAVGGDATRHTTPGGRLAPAGQLARRDSVIPGARSRRQCAETAPQREDQQELDVGRPPAGRPSRPGLIVC